MYNLIGSFYYKKTSKNNLQGEFLSNKADRVSIESAIPINPTINMDNFCGDYNVFWYDSDHHFGTLKITLNLNNIYELIWSENKPDNFVFEGQGFVIDGVLIGHYWGLKS